MSQPPSSTLTVLMAVLVVLAGCGAVPAGDDASPTTATAPGTGAPDAPSATAAPDTTAPDETPSVTETGAATPSATVSTTPPATATPTGPSGTPPGDASADLPGASVQLNEIDPANQRIELYVRAAESGATLEGWRLTTYDGANLTLPAISGLGSFDYVLLRAGPGDDDLDASDGNATVHLQLDGFLGAAGDEVGVYDPAGRLVDFVRYGGGNGDGVRGEWEPTDPGKSPAVGESLGRHGAAVEGSAWVSGPPSPGEPNLVRFAVDAYDTDVQLRNGIRVADPDPDVVGRTEVDFSVDPAHPVNNTTLRAFEEYVNFSLTFYNESGFNAPETGADGVLNVTLANASSAGKKGSTGATKISDGSVTIHVGFDPLTDKWTMEHELIHAIQVKRLNDTRGAYRRIGAGGDLFLTEGLAEYWGMMSAMENFDVDERTVLDAAEETMNYHIENFTRVSTRGVTNWQSDWGSYAGVYLLIKYIADTYGREKLVHIHNVTRNEGGLAAGANDTVGVDAIEKAFSEQPAHRNVTFPDIVANWSVWVYDNYTANVSVKDVGSINRTGNVSDAVRLSPWGFDIESIDLNNVSRSVQLNLTGQPGVNYSVTVLKEKPDGSVDRETVRLNGGALINISQNAENYSRLVLIKSQIEDAGTTTLRLRARTVPIDLVTNKTVTETSYAVGRNVTFTINVTNRGIERARTVVINDTLPANLSIVSVRGGNCEVLPRGILCFPGDLEPGETVTITLVANVTGTGTITNTAGAVGTHDPTVDPRGNNDDSATIEVGTSDRSSVSGPPRLRLAAAAA